MEKKRARVSSSLEGGEKEDRYFMFHTQSTTKGWSYQGVTKCIPTTSKNYDSQLNMYVFHHSGLEKFWENEVEGVRKAETR